MSGMYHLIAGKKSSWLLTDLFKSRINMFLLSTTARDDVCNDENNKYAAGGDGSNGPHWETESSVSVRKADINQMRFKIVKNNLGIRHEEGASRIR